jgi:hypothetical protein
MGAYRKTGALYFIFLVDLKVWAMTTCTENTQAERPIDSQQYTQSA